MDSRNSVIIVLIILLSTSTFSLLMSGSREGLEDKKVSNHIHTTGPPKVKGKPVYKKEGFCPLQENKGHKMQEPVGMSSNDEFGWDI
jgi:hypothetical protein